MQPITKTILDDMQSDGYQWVVTELQETEPDLASMWVHFFKTEEDGIAYIENNAGPVELQRKYCLYGIEDEPVQDMAIPPFATRFYLAEKN